MFPRPGLPLPCPRAPPVSPHQCHPTGVTPRVTPWVSPHKQAPCCFPSQPGGRTLWPWQGEQRPRGPWPRDVPAVGWQFPGVGAWGGQWGPPGWLCKEGARPRGDTGDMEAASTPPVTLSPGCTPCLGVPPPLHTGPGGAHVPAPSPPQPMQAASSSEPAGCGTVTVAVTHGTASRPGLLHGDIVPTPSVPKWQWVPARRWLSRRRCSPQLSQAAVPAAVPGSPAGTGTRRGTSDSTVPHDRVLGFLTQLGRWQRGGLVPMVARARRQGRGTLAWLR